MTDVRGGDVAREQTAATFHRRKGLPGSGDGLPLTRERDVSVPAPFALFAESDLHKPWARKMDLSNARFRFGIATGDRCERSAPSTAHRKGRSRSDLPFVDRALDAPQPPSFGLDVDGAAPARSVLAIA